MLVVTVVGLKNNQIAGKNKVVVAWQCLVMLAIYLAGTFFFSLFCVPE
jgi:hypothetical protein